MKRKHIHWWLAVMLPGFVLRSLVPIGFMPMLGADRSVQLVICDSYAPLPWADMPMDMSMGPGMKMPGGGMPAHQDHGSCPYGSSPALGALPGPATPIVAVQRATQLALASAQIAYFEISLRAQSPRGPPV